MPTSQIIERQTKYCTSVVSLLQHMGHATNQELLVELRSIYPDLSATTVHRATQRLASRGKIAIAPNAIDGSIRYDVNLVPHDHFACDKCGQLADADLKDKIMPIINRSIVGCDISGRLTITGVCHNCLIKGGI